MSNTTHPMDLSPAERELLTHLRYRAAELQQGTVTEARDLYDSELWDGLPPDECRPLGRVISSWVRRGLLPLEPAGFNSSRHNLYRRI